MVMGAARMGRAVGAGLFVVGMAVVAPAVPADAALNCGSIVNTTSHPSGGVGQYDIDGDGDRIVFESTRNYGGQNPDGGADLWVRDLTAGTYTNITDSTSNIEFRNLSIDAAGDTVVYMKAGVTTGHVYAYDVPSNQETLLTAHQAYSPYLSSSGNRVVFTSQENINGSNPAGGPELFVVAPTGGPVTRAVFLDTEPAWARLSGDGTTVFWTETGSPDSTLYRAAVGGSSRVPVVSDDFVGFGFAVDGDGSSVAYLASEDSGFVSHAWLSTGGSTQRLSPDPQSEFSDLYGIDIDDAGDRVSWIGGTNPGNGIKVYDVSAGQLALAGYGSLPPDPGSAISADGTKVLGAHFGNVGGTNPDNGIELFRATCVGGGGGGPKPDGHVKKGDGAYAGNNVYNTTGASQTRSASVSAGGTATFTVRAQNDGDAIDDVGVRGQASTGRFRFTYTRAGVDITAQVVAGTYQIDDLAPGATANVKVAVKARAGAPRGSSINGAVTLTSRTDTSAKDRVRVVVTRA